MADLPPSPATLTPPPQSQPLTPPSVSTPPPQTQPSTPPPPQTQPSTPPLQTQPLTPPPTPSTPAEEPNANSSDPPVPTPPSNAPPPKDAGPPPLPVTTPPVDPSSPPNSSTPPPSPPATPPVEQPPAPVPPTPSPPQTVPPVSSPPSTLSPPPVSPPNPPTSAPPPPPVVTPPASSPPPSSNPPPPSTPTPPSSEPPKQSPPPSTPTPPSSEPPKQSPPPRTPPPPPSSDPPVESPPPPPTSQPPQSSLPPPTSEPPKRSPPPPEPPQSSPSPPAAEPPSSTSSPPPSNNHSVPPPSAVPLTPPASGSTPPIPITPSSLVPNSTSGAPPVTAKSSSKEGIGSGATVAIGVIAGVLILGLVGLIAFCFIKRKKRQPGGNGGHVIPASMGSSPRSDGKLLVKTEYPGAPFGGGSGTDTPTDHGGFGHSRSYFTYQELLEATGGFSDKNLLGEGGFGYVYKGVLGDGREVAVKQLKVGGQQGEREFKAEVEIISRIHHRHLVSLVGYCIWESRRLLVYDYVPNNTLHYHLHGGRSVLDWAKRVKIAAGAARGLAYLHEDCHPRIIHRDIKSSNILLNNKYDAQVSDFGLAKLAMDADTHVSTRVMGTFGYLAPEYATSGKLTEKSDVYSFGVVLLELVTGRKPVDESQPLGDESLVEWARPKLSHALDTGEYEGLIDTKLGRNYIESEMFRMIEAAAACVRHSSAKRPRMGQVVRALDGISDSGDLSNGLRVGESQLYDSAQQSAEIKWFRRMAFGGGSQDISSSEFFNSRAQNIGHSTYSGQNVVNSAADILRQQRQSSQNVGFSGQSQQTFHTSNEGNQHTVILREDSLNS